MLSSTTQADGKTSVIRTQYDNWGRKTHTHDPIKGTWRYTYNAFGELYTQTTAAQHTFTFDYDVFGRQIRSYEINEGTRCWYYGTTGNETGKLTLAQKFKGQAVQCNNSTTAPIQRHYHYNQKGQLAHTDWHIGQQHYRQSQHYDQYGRASTTDYPTGYQSLSATNHYNAYGYLHKLTAKQGNQPSRTVKTINQMNDSGQVSQFTHGNGLVTYLGYDERQRLDGITLSGATGNLHQLNYTYDTLGNVRTRQSRYQLNSSQQHYHEAYSYDTLNRLTENKVNGHSAGVTHTIYRGAYTAVFSFISSRFSKPFLYTK